MTLGIDPQPRNLGRGSWVGFSVDRAGYTVRVYNPESEEVFSYQAGNSPFDSAAFVPLDSKSPRVPVRTLRKWARQTAQEIATEWGVNLPMIQEESSDD